MSVLKCSATDRVFLWIDTEKGQWPVSLLKLLQPRDQMFIVYNLKNENGLENVSKKLNEIPNGVCILNEIVPFCSTHATCVEIILRIHECLLEDSKEERTDNVYIVASDSSIIKETMMLLSCHFAKQRLYIYEKNRLLQIKPFD